jgi:hypothetical protein
MIKFLSSLLIVAAIISNTTSCNSPAEGRQDCVDTLRRAIAEGSTVFIKVHAGEALVSNGYPEKVEETFLPLREVNLTAATRVLARIYKETDHKKYGDCIATIINQYLHADSSHPRLVAVESLGKLGYSDTLPQIIADAKNGEDGFRPMARWVMSNNGAQQMEDSLAALLTSPEIAHHRGAAYALRFKKSVSDHTYQLLKQCAAFLAVTEPQRVYILSALFVHARPGTKEAAKKQLLEQLEGPVAARYETCEALSIAGDASDLPTLEKLLKDEDEDVRVAAANAILKITRKSNS